MKAYESVKGYPNLVRDPNSNAILNVDYQAIELARANKEARRQAKRNLENRIENLEKDLGDIKNALNTLIEKL